FWIKHVFVPNYTSASAPQDESIGVLFDQPDASLVRDFQVPAAGTYRIWLAATTYGGSGEMPRVGLDVDGGATLSQTQEIANNAPLQHAAWRDMGL
ncbi:MAG: hypothetical protein KC466_11315, partial [Myxococcales bacterium]|nr:hypothetical protein [Myxococcales bacterium]